jgi:4-hydroxy-3-polyprenylbenzoate decarboxylase
MARLFLPYLKLHIPELVDFDLPISGGARNLAILAIEKTYPTQAWHVATVAWGIRPFQFARLLVLLDAESDVRDVEQVVAKIVTHVNLMEDVLAFDGATDPMGFPSRRAAIDGTRVLSVALPAGQAVQDENIEKLVTDRWANMASARSLCHE